MQPTFIQMFENQNSKTMHMCHLPFLQAAFMTMLWNKWSSKKFDIFKSHKSQQKILFCFSSSCKCKGFALNFSRQLFHWTARDAQNPVNLEFLCFSARALPPRWRNHKNWEINVSSQQYHHRGYPVRPMGSFSNWVSDSSRLTILMLGTGTQAGCHKGGIAKPWRQNCSI